METDKVTESIDEILEPYLGKIGYGRLRKGEVWPTYDKYNGSYNFNLAYDTDFFSTLSLKVVLNDDNTISLKDHTHQYPIKIGLRRLEQIIKAIPSHRIKKTKEKIKNYYIGDNRKSPLFEEALIMECSNWKAEPTDMYTPEELEILKAA